MELSTQAAAMAAMKHEHTQLNARVQELDRGGEVKADQSKRLESKCTELTKQKSDLEHQLESAHLLLRSALVSSINFACDLIPLFCRRCLVQRGQRTAVDDSR